ncbi:MAG: hypothetical protein ABJE95_05390 [Byssovorax sp.]
MKGKTIRAIVAGLGLPNETRWTTDEHNRILVKDEPWDWEIEERPDLLPVSSTFNGKMYMASLDVFTSGGAGLSSRYFVEADDRLLDLQSVDDMRFFLERYAVLEDPVMLADLLKRCQGQGRMANVYREDGRLESSLDDSSRSAVKEMGLMDPVMVGDELAFDAWRVVMAGNDEAIEVEHWTLSMKGPDGPEWHRTPLAGLLRFE